MKKTLLIALGLVCLVSLGAILFIQSYLTIDPPDVKPVDTSAFKIRTRGDSLVFCDNSWFHKSGTGLYELYTEGDPYYRGLVTGKLIRKLLYKQEKTFVDQIHRFVPSGSYLRFLKFLVAIFDFDINKYIKKEYLREIYGLSQYASDEFDDIGVSVPYRRADLFAFKRECLVALHLLKVGQTDPEHFGGQRLIAVRVFKYNLEHGTLDALQYHVIDRAGHFTIEIFKIGFQRTVDAG